MIAARKTGEGREGGSAATERRPAPILAAAALRSRMEQAPGPRGRGGAPAAGPAGPQERVAVACDGVIDIAAALFGVPGRDLRSPSRSAVPVSRVRQIAMYVAHVTLRLSMREVGQGFGRDRTTVLHACHLVEDLREDEEFDRIVARVELVVAAAFGIPAERD